MSQLLRTAAHNSAVGRDSEDDRGFTTSDGDAGFTSEGWESDSSSVNGGNNRGASAASPSVPSTWLASFQKGYEDITSLDRKASSTSARESTLNEMLFLLRVKYCMPAIEILGGSAPLGNAFIRTLRSARSERESSLASLCLAMLAATDAAEAHSICTASAETFQRAINSGNSEDTTKVESKAVAAAIIGYAAVNVFANSLFTLDNALEYFHGIIESDGDNISRMGDGAVVLAAIRGFSAVAASMLPLDDNDDRKRSPQTPIHLFQRFGASLVNQLDSTHTEVRNEAGKAIALVVSNSQLDASLLKSHSNGGKNGYNDEDEQEEDDEPEDEGLPDLKELAEQLEELSRESSKHISKSARREQHSVFRDVGKTVNSEIAALSGNDEQLGGGGGGEEEDGVGKGRGAFPVETIKFGKSVYRIDTWVKLMRIEFLRLVFAEGFQTQFAYNSTIRRSYLGYKGRVMLKGNNKESQVADSDDEAILTQASATKASTTDGGNVGRGREARKQERVEKTKTRQILNARENRGFYHS